MNGRKVADILAINNEVLETAKGHKKSTVKFATQILEQLPQDMIIYTRANTSTPSNVGDLAEVLAGYKLNRKEYMGVALKEKNDLQGILKNEVKACYSNNRPSNTIEDKGHYMVTNIRGKVEIIWVSRDTVRACKQHMVKNNRGGKTYAQAVIEYQGA